MQYKTGVCTFCGTGCGNFLKVSGGRIEGTFPSQGHPIGQGRLCVRGWNLHELLRSGDRILEPRIRRHGVLQPTSLEEALEWMAARVHRLRKSGDEIAVLGSPRSSNEEQYLLLRLSRAALKTSNIGLDSEGGHRKSLDILSRGAGFPGMTGSIEEIRESDLILLVDYDATIQNPIVGSEIHFAAREGRRVVSVDGRRTRMARLSTDFIQPLPGTSSILLGALCRVLIERDLVDDAVRRSQAADLQDLERQLEPLSSENVERWTGIRWRVIEELALDLASVERAMVFYPSGVSGLSESSMKLIYNLFLLAGKIGRHGCGVNPVAGINNLQGGYDMGIAPDLLTGFQSSENPEAVERFRSAWGNSFEVSAGRPVYEMLAEGPQPKLLLVVDHDEGIIRYADRIREIDCVVYAGAFENAFQELADLVLPVAAPGEESGTYTSAERRVQLLPKMVEPPRDVLPAWRLFQRIGSALGEDWDYRDSASVMAEIADLTDCYSKISHARLEASCRGLQWPCTSEVPEGTAHLEREPEEMRLVALEEPLELPSSDPEFPFRLMVGKAHHFWHQNNLMRKTFIPMREFNATLLLYPDGYVEIHPADAEEIGVRDKWDVCISSGAGEMQLEVKISEDVQPGTAYVPYFVKEMISRFLLEHREAMFLGEDASIPVRIERAE